jgi:plasmid stabilization system protein ParE
MPGADYRIAWRPKALEDLRSIVRYIAQDSPIRARTFGKKLREKVQPLAQHPLLGHEGRPGLPADVRELGVIVLFVRIGALSLETQHPCVLPAGDCSAAGPAN